jgi:hypothetical protein
MPLGFERLNERTTRPNPLINFIKPLAGTTSSTAHDFLSRIAAQCYPVMKANHIAVMSLEEYPSNTEFIGRNFNAGEVIQLVLRSRSGAWLPFKYVQMTMMHELAHCKQMNHSGAFWKVRNAYAEEMRGLWEKKYLGEGLWGKGRSLENGRFMHDVMPDTRELPEHTCGGTYRRRGRKRKRGAAAGQEGRPQVSYAERKQRRIFKKFGDPTKANTLGTDEDVRIKLEDGKKPKGKPRVAGSNRGRELRAAAALARFEQQPKKEEIKQEEDSGSDTEDEFDWLPTDDESKPVRRDGKDFVRICEAEDEQDENVKREMEELQELHSIPSAPLALKPGGSQPYSRTNGRSGNGQATAKAPAPIDGLDTESDEELQAQLPKPRTLPSPPAPEGSDTESETETETEQILLPAKAATTTNTPASNTCAACSPTNDSTALLCIACSNVLAPSHIPNHWRCTSDACRDGVYINAGDYGRCQVCGAAKPVS